MGALNDFLAEIAPKSAEEPVAETPQAAEATPADQTGVTEATPPTAEAATAAQAPAAAAPATDAPPASGQEHGHLVPRAALEDERNKRKDWKAKAIRLEEQNAQLTRVLAERGGRQAPQPNQQMPQQAPQRPDVLQDPEGYTRYIETQLQATPIMIRREMSEAMLLETKPDAAEVIQEFAEMARSNPALVQQMDRQMNPAKFAYDYVKRSRVMQEIGSDPEAWRAQQLEALKAQWLAEMQAQQPVVPAQAASTPKPPAQIPPSLANARNVGPRTGPAPSALSFDETFAKKY